MGTLNEGFEGQQGIRELTDKVFLGFAEPKEGATNYHGSKVKARYEV